MLGGMESTTKPLGTCKRCHRQAVVNSDGLGPECRKLAAEDAELRAAVDPYYTPEQVAKALQLIADGGIVATPLDGVYLTVSSDGHSRYQTMAEACNCRRGSTGRRCYHMCAAVMLDIHARRTRPASRPAREYTADELFSRL